MLVAFDLDGTLEDSRTDMVLAIQKLRTQLSLPFRSFDDLVPWVSKGMPTLYAKAFDDLENEGMRQQLPKLYAECYQRVIVDSTVLYEGILELLTNLSGKVELAVITNKPEHLSRVLLRNLGILEFFSAVIGGDTMPVAKPDPIMIEGAMTACKVTDTCIMVGDSRGDVVMSRDFGAISIWCKWGYHDSILDVEADYVVSHPSEVYSIVEMIQRRMMLN